MDTVYQCLWIILFCIVLTIAIFIYVRLMLRCSSKRCESMNKMYGKTVIITGGNSGVGYETAIDLASRGAKVILVCRNELRAAKAREKIVLKSKNENVFYKIVDISDLNSVRKFCNEILAYEERLDVLINNAGAVFRNRRESAQGYELTLATNHHGHFLLTTLLIELLKKSCPSRIINVSSMAHYRFHLDLNDLHFRRRRYGLIIASAQSKLCNILFTKELSRRLIGTGVTVNALTPGSAATEILDKEGTISGKLLKWCTKIFFKTPKEGAQTSIYLAVADEVANISGEYFENCQISVSSKPASDRDLAQKLWDISEVEVRLTEDERILN